MEPNLNYLDKEERIFWNKLAIIFGRLWFMFFSIIMLGFSIFVNYGSIDITNESIVLSFIGILATFVVVGNYSQTIQIKAETEKAIKEIEVRQDELLILESKLEILKDKQSFNAIELYRSIGNMYFKNNEYFAGIHYFFMAINSFNDTNDTSDYSSFFQDEAIGKTKLCFNSISPEHKSLIDFDEFIKIANHIKIDYFKTELIKILEKHKKSTTDN